jgi:hypothetical protein
LPLFHFLQQFFAALCPLGNAKALPILTRPPLVAGGITLCPNQPL